MKKSHSFLLVIPFLAMLNSCKPESNQSSFLGPNGRMLISVEATRKVTLDPWMCGINLQFDSIKWEVIQTEVMADRIDSTSTFVRWINDSTAVLNFEQRDESVKSYKLSAGNGLYHFEVLSELH